MVVGATAHRRGRLCHGTANGDGESGFQPDAVDSPSANIRLGLGMVRGLSAAGLASILQARERDGPFESLEDFCKRTHVPRPVVENLILVRAFDFTGYNVQELLWRLGQWGQSPVSHAGTLPGQTRRREIGDCPYFPTTDHRPPTNDLQGRSFAVGRMSDVGCRISVGQVAVDLHVLGVSTTKNAFSFWRPRMEEMAVTPSIGLYEREDGDRVKVAGIVVARARPPTRSGKTAIFISLEDEFGLVDIAVFEEAYQRCGRALYSSPVLCVEGKLTRKGKLDLSVTAEEVIGMGSWQDFELTPGRGLPSGPAPSAQDTTSDRAANDRLTPARGGERRQAMSY